MHTLSSSTFCGCEAHRLGWLLIESHDPVPCAAIPPTGGEEEWLLCSHTHRPAPCLWQAELERQLLGRLSRFVVHDVRGKWMGISGLLREWKNQVPEAPYFAEDLQLFDSSLAEILASVSPLHHATGQHHSSTESAVSAPHLDQLAGLLPRFFGSPQLFRIEWEYDPDRVQPAWHPVFWHISKAVLAISSSRVGAVRTTLGISFSPRDLGGAWMQIEIENAALAEWMHSPVQERKADTSLEHWMWGLACNPCFLDFGPGAATIRWRVPVPLAFDHALASTAQGTAPVFTASPSESLSVLARYLLAHAPLPACDSFPTWTLLDKAWSAYGETPPLKTVLPPPLARG